MAKSSLDAIPHPSALSTLLSDAGARRPANALPLEVVHNLQHQHGWKNLRVQPLTTVLSHDCRGVDLIQHATATSYRTKMASLSIITGTPPRHLYIHPDFQAHMVMNNIQEADIPLEQEWVLPLAIGEPWSLRKFCEVFDALPVRRQLRGQDGFQHQDPKRILLGMLAHNGMGGDGTIVYYIMHEGDVKPRQN